MAANLTLSRAVELLSKGNVFVKFHERNNKSAKRVMFMDGGSLYWCKEGVRTKSAKHSCSISQISRVHTTKVGEVYTANDAAKRAPEDLCLSLAFAAAGMSLNLQAPNREVRDTWARAIELVQQDLLQRGGKQPYAEKDAHGNQRPPPLQASTSLSPIDRVFGGGVAEEDEGANSDDEDFSAAKSPNPRRTQQQQQQQQQQLSQQPPPRSQGFSDGYVQSPPYAHDQHQYDVSRHPYDQQFDEHGRPVQQYDDLNRPYPPLDQHGNPYPASQQWDQDGNEYPPFDDQGRPYQRYDEQGQPIYDPSRDTGADEYNNRHHDVEDGARNQEPHYAAFSPSADEQQQMQSAQPAARPQLPKQARPQVARQGTTPVHSTSAPPPSSSSTLARQASSPQHLHSGQTPRSEATGGMMSTPQPINSKPIPQAANPRMKKAAPAAEKPAPQKAPLYGSAFDRCVLPKPLPAEMQSMVDVALASAIGQLRGRVRQKNEDVLAFQHTLDDLEQQLAQAAEREKLQASQWEALAMQSRTAGGSVPSGAITIRLAAPNLEHEAPHSWVAVLYMKPPLSSDDDEPWEFSQCCSLMPSVADGGETYTPKLTLSPTELFAFRPLDEQDDSGHERSRNSRNGRASKIVNAGEDDEGELVGALLKIELWDLINKQMYGDYHQTPRKPASGAAGFDHEEAQVTGYEGHVIWDMNDLIAARHHVLSLPLKNTQSSRKEQSWAQKKVQMVLQYIAPDDDAASAGNGGNPASALAMQALEDELATLRTKHADLQAEHALYMSHSNSASLDSALRKSLEDRLAAEQSLRIKMENENMRLRPRVLEAVDTGEELALAKSKIRELETLVATLHKELRGVSMPTTAHGMIDELVSFSSASPPTPAQIARLKKFILDQDRVREMLVAEIGMGARASITAETTHDELVRREAALQAHTLALESDKKSYERHAAEIMAALKESQAQTISLSARCEAAENESAHLRVSVGYLSAQVKQLSIHKPDAAADKDDPMFASIKGQLEADARRQQELYVANQAKQQEALREKIKLQAAMQQAQQAAANGGSSGGGSAAKGPKPVVYTDDLSSTLSAAGSNWQAR